MYWIERAPLPLVGVVFLATLVAAHELARLSGRHLSARAVSTEARGYLVSSALALLGLLMAFTFAAAQERFLIRQDLVVSEANAIGTAYLRAQMTDPPGRARLSVELERYAEARTRFNTVRDLREDAANARETGAAQGVIWRDLTEVVRSNTVANLNLGLMNSFNEMFDLAAAARAAREARIPVAILRALLFCSLTVAAVVGFTEGDERRWSGVLAGVLVLLTLAFCLILDLDRPLSGAVQVNRAPLQRALDDIRASEAAKRAAPAAPASAIPNLQDQGPRQPG